MACSNRLRGKRSASGSFGTKQTVFQAGKSSQDAGASPLFPPHGLCVELAEADLAHVVHRSPTLFGLDRSCWTLTLIRSVIGWMARLSLAAVCKLLQRFGLCYKRGRAHVHSPDRLYDAKLAAIEAARVHAREARETVVFLYEDEHTANLRPQVGRSYQAIGTKASRATGSHSQIIRLAGVLDVATGQVLCRRRGSFNVKEMFRFFYHIEQHYLDKKVIYIALDNWPVHFHGYVKDHLARIKSRIVFLPLPTYAPWTNPMEKFWLKLNREFMKHHPYGCREDAFRDALDLWLDKHRVASDALLHEVGLLPQSS
jgi:transposase